MPSLSDVRVATTQALTVKHIHSIIALHSSITQTVYPLRFGKWEASMLGTHSSTFVFFFNLGNTDWKRVTMLMLVTSVTYKGHLTAAIITSSYLRLGVYQTPFCSGTTFLQTPSRFVSIMHSTSSVHYCIIPSGILILQLLDSTLWGHDTDFFYLRNPVTTAQDVS